jgi:hypothetical protein
MRTSLLAVAALMALMGDPRSASGQGWDAMSVGSRISLRVNDSLLPPGLARKNAIVGLVANYTPEALYLQITTHDTLRIPRATITRLSLSRGKSRARSAVRLGLIEAIVLTVLPPARGEYFDSDHFGSIAIGAGLGALIGAVWPPEEWKKLKP